MIKEDLVADGNGSFTGANPYTQFWSDMMGGMAAPGMTAPPASQEMLEQMRKTFFDVLSNNADEFLRSEQFLTAMKRSVDGSLAFRKQINEFLSKSLESLQMPSSADVEEVVQLVRSMDQRISDKLEEITERMERLEQSLDRSSTVTGSENKPTARRSP